MSKTKDLLIDQEDMEENKEKPSPEEITKIIEDLMRIVADGDEEQRIKKVPVPSK